jgi:tight adherence protein C
MILLVLGALFLVGTTVVLFARAFVVRPAQTLEQIDSYGFNAVPDADGAESSKLRDALDRLAARIGAALAARFGSLREDEIRRRLRAAGMYDTSPGKFIGYRALITLGLPLLWIWLAAASSIHAVIAFAGVVTAAGIGWIAPARLVKVRTVRRFAAIDRELPELIDLLVVTVEAGLSFVGSLQLASRRITGPLGEELRLTVQEQSMGLSQAEALGNMLTRCETAMTRSFVRSIVQGESLGVSTGQIMRNLAVDFRKRRRQAAEELAQKAPIKMLFPLIFFIFPAMFVIILAPAVFEILDALGSR